MEKKIQGTNQLRHGATRAKAPAVPPKGRSHVQVQLNLAGWRQRDCDGDAPNQRPRLQRLRPEKRNFLGAVAKRAALKSVRPDPV